MATKTINIKDAYLPELIEVFGERWPEEILDIDGVTLIPNPETKQAYANRAFDRDIKAHIHDRVRAYRRKTAWEALNHEEIVEDL